MEPEFKIGDFVCTKDNLNEVYRIIGYSKDFIGIKSTEGHTRTIERTSLILVPNNDERVLEFEKIGGIFLKL